MMRSIFRRRSDQDDTTDWDAFTADLAGESETTAPVRLATDLPGTEESEPITPLVELLHTNDHPERRIIETPGGIPVVESFRGCRTYGCPSRFVLPYATPSVTALDALMRAAGWTLGPTGWVCNGHTPLAAIAAPADWKRRFFPNSGGAS